MHDTLGESVQIFAHTLYNHYSAPKELDFDSQSKNVFVINEKLKHYNAP